MKYNLEKLRLIHLFSGVGAPEMALKRLGIPLEIIGFSEIDKYAIQSYKAIHGDIPALGDVSKIELLPECDMVVYGSPCLTGDTLVLTSEGYKNLIDVNIGDLVVGHDGAFHKVTNFLEQGTKPTYKIKAMGMDSIRCTDNHKFYVRKMHRKCLTVNGKRKNIRCFKEPEWIECKDLDGSYYMGMPINNLSELPNWNGVEYTRWKEIHKDLPIELSEFWYIVGRYLGDGWVRTRKDRNNCNSSVIICCGKHEVEELESKINIFRYTLVEDKSVYKLQISNKELATFFTQFGHGASEKFIPSFVFNLPINLLKSFVEGYLDSDGSYTQNMHKGSSISRKLIYGMTQCIAKVYKRPFSIYHTKRKPTCVIEGRVVNQRDSYAFTFHENARKQDKAFYEDGYIWYPIQSIDPTGLAETVYDITVEDCHSFVANNCITHNCQDFSCAGNQKGLYDENGNQTRSGLLLEVERLMENAKREGTQPKFLLMENVKNLVGKQFKSDFDRWLEKLDELGYNNYWQVLNAKDYGIPQNRERVFVMSILREYDAFGYKFPSAFPLKKCLRDVLEQVVDDKYYLSELVVNRFKSQLKGDNIIGTTAPTFRTIGQRDIVYGVDGCMGTLVATDYKQPKQIGIPINSESEDVGNIYEQHHDRLRDVEYPCIAASRGRNPENPSDRTVGAPTEQRLEINTDGVSNTLTTVSKDNLVLEKTTMLQLPHGSNSGGVKETEVAPTITTSKWEYNNVLVESDDTDVQFYNKYNDTMLSDVAPTQTTNCGSFTSSSSVLVLEGMTTNSDTPVRIGNIYGDDRGTGYAGNVWDQDGLAPTLTTMTGGNRQPMIIDDTQGFDGVRTYEDYSPTLRANRNGLKVESDLKIRRLTPLECWRLMGFSDEDFKKAKESGISDTQAYKQAGNSIVVDVLYYIFKMLLIEEYDNCKKVRRKKLIDWK